MCAQRRRNGAGARPPDPPIFDPRWAVGVTLPLVKISVALAMGGIGVAAAMSGHDGVTLQRVLGALTALGAVGTAVQIYAITLFRRR